MVAPALVAIAAPIVQQLLSNGLGLLANAVQQKGKAVIEEKLGVKIEDHISNPEGLLKLKQLETEHEEFLINAAMENRKIDLDFLKQDDLNTADARQMNARLQESANATDFAKDAAYYLDFLIVGATIGLGGLLFFKTIPDDNVQIANIMFGSLLALCGTIVNFHRGNNRSSQQRAIAQIKKDEQHDAR